MSNLNKANSVAHKWVESMGGLEAIRHDHGSDLSGLMQALEAAGLLAPDLPGPEIRHLEEVNTDVLAWKSDHIEVGVYKSRIAMDDPPDSAMTPAEARELAHALLAAAEYAEKEQDNE